jgi:alpha-L-fucosidase
MKNYQKSDFSILQKTKYGIGFHYTTWTAPKKGELKPFEQAVNDFDVDKFVSQVVETGAGHVMLTITHGMHYMPCPNKALDTIIDGRTTDRDLLMEIADALAEENILLMFYYNEGMHGGDPAWIEAITKNSKDPNDYYKNHMSVLRWLGEHYGEKLIGFWVDHIFAQISDETWWNLTQSMKAGNPNRLVTYNSGVENHFLRTEYMDYWAGELCRLNYFPEGDITPSGLPWYSYVAWHPDFGNPCCGEWGLQMHTRDKEWNSPNADSVADFLKHYIDHNGAVTFNLFCYQDGTIYEHDLNIMKELKKKIR